ncbi:MAG: hypothetical protein K5666_00200 [Bacilli bacterium]|nr:hypothetical protein [Bacilli bacterium]
MNNELIEELKKAIEQLKLEILEKQEELDSLINQYQELSGIELEDDNITPEE